MFDLPETKRVRRNELFSQSRSPSPPPDNAVLSLDLDFITVAPAATPDAPTADNDDGDDGDGIAFQLFSSATRPQQKVTLKDPTPPPTAEDVWERVARTQRRPEAYYVLSEEDMKARREALRFEEVVVSAEDVLKGSAMAWPGCRVPWKVTVVTAKAVPGIAGRSGKRTKPGKKRRIYLRKEEQKKKAAEEARLKSIAGRKKFAGLPKEEREAKEREEKNRKNREKKIKRRIREKAKKEAARAAGGEVKEDSRSDSEEEEEEGVKNKMDVEMKE